MPTVQKIDYDSYLKNSSIICLTCQCVVLNFAVAMKVVNNVVLKSEHILEILCRTGLKLPEIAAVAPRLQKAFRAYVSRVEESYKNEQGMVTFTQM